MPGTELTEPPQTPPCRKARDSKVSALTSAQLRKLVTERGCQPAPPPDADREELLVLLKASGGSDVVTAQEMESLSPNKKKGISPEMAVAPPAAEPQENLSSTRAVPSAPPAGPPTWACFFCGLGSR